MSTRSGSSRRKHEQPKRKTEEDKIDLTDGDEDPGENGVGTDDDVIELPEGTVVVNPEPVDDQESTPKAAKKRQQKSSLSMSVELNKLMSRILCTSCGKQINPMNPGAVRRHPWLKCVTCKKCYKFLKSGPIQKDADGLDEQCRWCGEGGRLYGCDYCHNTFCRPCIKRNLGRSEAAKVEEGTGKWKCYVCRPHMLKELVENCNKIIAAIEKEEQREKARLERAKEREKQAKIKEKEGNQSKDEKAADKSRDSKAGTPTRISLRAPIPKLHLKIEDSDKNKSNKTSAKDTIVISDDKPSKSYKNEPIVISDSKSDQKGSAVLSLLKEKTPVMVGPRPRQPVTMPYINKTVPISSVNNQGNRMMNNNPNSNPLLMNAMQLKFGNTYTRGLNPRPPINEIQGLLQSVYPYNVDSAVDKLIAASQSLSLSLNGIKTDLAIGKLTNVNMFNARNTAASSLKSGLAVFFNSVREIFNVQITATAGGKGGQASNANVPSSTVVIDGKPAGTNLTAMANEYLSTSTPIKEEGGKQKLDISEIPILVDDSPMKKSISEPVIVDKADSSEKEGSEGAESKDGSCVVVSQSDDDNKKDDDNESVSDREEKTNKKSKTEMKKITNKEKDKKSKKENDSDIDSNESDGAMEVDDEEEEEEEKEEEGDDKNSDEEKVPEDALDNVGRKGQKLMQEYKKLAEQIESQNEKGENSENLAAQLELLKEMADELSQELGDEDDEEDEQEDEEKDEGDDKRKGSKKSTRAKDIENKSDSKSNKSRSEKNEDEKSSHSGSKRSLRSSVDSEKLKTKEKEKTSDGEKSAKQVKERKVKSSEKDSISESEKSPCKSEARSARLRSKKDEDTDSEAETSKESQKPVSKSKSEGDIAKDGKSKSDKKKSEQGKSKSEADDSTEKGTERKAAKSPAKVSKETIQKKGKSKVGKVTEIVTDEETDDSDIDGAPKEESAEVDLPNDSDDSSELEIDDSNRQSRSTRAKAKGQGKGSKSKSPVRSKGKDDGKEKEGKSKKSSKRSDDDDEEGEDYKSDSSNFDPELEKEIKGISKSLASDGKGKKKKKGKESQEGSEVEAEDKKGKKGKEKKKVEKKGKESDEEDSSDENDEEVNEEEEEEEEDEEDNLSPSKLRKLRAAREAARQKEEEEGEEENGDVDSNASDDSDLEVSFPKIQGSKKGKKKAAEDMSEDSDFQPTTKKRIRSKLLDAKISGEEDSDEDKPKKGKKGGKGGKRKRKVSSSEEDEEDEEDEDEEESGTEEYSDDDEGGGKKKKKKGKGKKGKGKKGKKGKGKKRRRIKMLSDDEDDGQKDPGEDDELEDDSDDEGQGGFMKRKKIRKLMKNKKLTSTTKQAQKAEEARRKRIEERQKEFNSYIEVEGEEEEEDLPEGVEREKPKDDKEEGKDKKKKEENGDTISKILGSPRKVPVTTKLILEMDKEKKKALIEVDRTLIRKLKPHQVDAVRFMYNCTVESVERLKKKEESGSGCIVAHCMGLGKTLSVITYVHTMLKSHKYTKMSKCLVVCPLNTVLNWVNEFEIWLNDVDFEIEVYELSRVKMNSERAQMLKEWHSGGAGVMILGYDMYRNLVQGSHCKNKKQKAIFLEALVDPGPDLVVCDEGHILKNDNTSISKSMNKIKSKRRIVLTGTPLQNNLGEYHCMVNFVKPNLLGTRKEFGNRFVNPITNGQCTDSTVADVKLMKRRAHVLHEMLAGCVQRKDYSALTKFLPPKFEYVVSVRLAPIQMDLYQKHLDRGAQESIVSKGARLFKDYQALMRIWTHPWVLKLDEVRQQNKAIMDDSEDSFIDDYESGDDSFIDDSTSEGEVSPMDLDSGSEKEGKGKGKGKKKSRRTRSSRKKSNSDSNNSSDDEKKSNDDNEVVRKWTSRRRHNEEGAGASWMDIGVPANEYVNKDVSKEWWAEYVKEEDQYKMELSGKLTLLFEILKMCEDIGDKVLVFSQSLLSLDIIEDFLAHIDETNQNPDGDKKEEDKKEDKKDEGKKEDKKVKENGEVAGGSGASGADAGGSGDGPEKKEDKFAEYGKNWTRGADYFRMDGSTNAQNRKAAQNMFNDEENYRARLFLISTKAGSLGINLVSANRVIIFDASWNPSHDIQSIFRVYRFGQVKPVYVYRFLAQGTMEEKIYERQVTKQSLSQRVVDEHQIERHFTTADLQELYQFTPDRLDDPNRKEKLPMLPKDHMLAELMTNHKEWIVTFHEHDSLLENIVAQELSEEEKKAAWEDYEEEKKGLRVNPMMNMYGGMAGMMGQGMPGMGGMPMMNQGMMNPAVFKNLLDVGQSTLGPNGVLRIVQDLKNRFPNLPPDMFQQRVQAVLRQILTNQIMQQSEMQRRQLDNQQMAELNRLYQVKQQIQQQERILQQSRIRMAGIGGATGVKPGVGGAQPQMRISGSEPNLTGMKNQNQNQR